MDLDLSGRTALVTGGGSGIGAACARELHDLGASVVVADLSGEAARRVASELGPRTGGVWVDVTDPVSVRSMVGFCVERFSQLDIAVNCAGVGMPVKATVRDTGAVEWGRVTAINLDGVFHCLQAELGAMSRGSSIVNIASVLAEVADAGASGTWRPSTPLPA